MATLYYSETSPFARKVRISMKIAGIYDAFQMELVDTMQPTEAFLQSVPLGKVPALLKDDGQLLYDSRVIIEYINALGGGVLIPDGPLRYDALVQQALADGILDACLLQVYEVRFRDEGNRNADWVERQRLKTSRALFEAERRVTYDFHKVHIGHIALACALGYLDLRFNGKWREQYLILGKWLQQFDDHIPAYAETRPVSF
ncbi:glutathione S-transferase N-terminal domain-containing protein [Methylorubrum thiocyanatum]|uniref:glutathione S-transferase n=1 Tax=Methylorubrum thiocyanatum TaxID=47958 RepID=UPI003F80E3D3